MDGMRIIERSQMRLADMNVFEHPGGLAHDRLEVFISQGKSAGIEMQSEAGGIHRSHELGGLAEGGAEIRAIGFRICLNDQAGFRSSACVTDLTEKDCGQLNRRLMAQLAAEPVLGRAENHWSRARPSGDPADGDQRCFQPLA